MIVFCLINSFSYCKGSNSPNSEVLKPKIISVIPEIPWPILTAVRYRAIPVSVMNVPITRNIIVVIF